MADMVEDSDVDAAITVDLYAALGAPLRARRSYRPARSPQTSPVFSLSLSNDGW